MKKYLCLGILSLLSISCFAAKVQTGTRFGELKKGCVGSSFCWISTTAAPSASIIGTNWELSSDGRQITMTMSDDEAMKLPEEVSDEFLHGYFEIREAFTFPADLNNALESFTDIVLPISHNTVTHTDGVYTVIFKL